MSIVQITLYEQEEEMKPMESFLIFFYILDQGYAQHREDDLGGFLGACSPELWEDGWPMDMSIYDMWQEFADSKTVNTDNILQKTYEFLQLYERKFGLKFSRTKQWLIQETNMEIVHKAVDNSSTMYQRFQYEC